MTRLTILSLAATLLLAVDTFAQTPSGTPTPGPTPRPSCRAQRMDLNVKERQFRISDNIYNRYVLTVERYVERLNRVNENCQLQYTRWDQEIDYTRDQIGIYAAMCALGNNVPWSCRQWQNLLTRRLPQLDNMRAQVRRQCGVSRDFVQRRIDHYTALRDAALPTRNEREAARNAAEAALQQCYANGGV